MCSDCIASTALVLADESKELPMPNEGLATDKHIDETSYKNLKDNGLLIQFNSEADRTALLLKITENEDEFPCKFVADDALWIDEEQTSKALAAANAIGLHFRKAIAGPMPTYKRSMNPELDYVALYHSWKSVMEEIRLELDSEPS